MFERVTAILADYSDVEVSEMTEQSELVNDLGLCSFDMVNAVVEFEDEFDIEISDDDIPKMKTVKDIIDYINANS